ncbi:MAG: ubiquinol-cytochrome c reductase iron-sulfur subunit [Pseudomonadota bacterium]
MDREATATTRRSALFTGTAAFAAAGAPMALHPLARSLAPGPDSKLSTVEYDLNTISPGTRFEFLLWGYIPLEIRHRTPEEMKQALEWAEFPDPKSRSPFLPHENALDEHRSVAGARNYIIVKPVCTRLGCRLWSGKGDFGGWFCPCDATHYDVSDRVRKGPAERNLEIPYYHPLPGNRIRFVEGEI